MKFDVNAVFFSLVVGLLVTVAASQSFGTQSFLGTGQCALQCLRSPTGNSYGCLEGEYKPACASDSPIGDYAYHASYLPSCLPNNVPSYGVNPTNPLSGIPAPAPICLAPYNLAVCPASQFDSFNGCSVARVRPSCPAGKDYLSAEVGCQPSGVGVQTTPSPTPIATPLPDTGFTPTPTPVPTVVFYPTATAQASVSASATPNPKIVGAVVNAPLTQEALLLIFVLVSAGAYYFQTKRGG